MLKHSGVNKSVDSERSLFGLKGVYIILFLSVFMIGALLYLILSSFFPPAIVFIITGGSIVSFMTALIKLNKKYGVHIMDLMDAKRGNPNYLVRTSKKFKIK